MVPGASRGDAPGGAPLADKELEVWYVERDKPGYDPWNKSSLEERVKVGGRSVRLRTCPDDKAQLTLQEFDGIRDLSFPYQMIVRFNADRTDQDYKPAQLPQLEWYACSSPPGSTSPTSP